MKIHLNTTTPPAHCPILIQVPQATTRVIGAPVMIALPGRQALIRAERVGEILEEDTNYQVMVDGGVIITGRWAWTYP